MGMNIHIRIKNDIAYSGKMGENYIEDFIKALEELEKQTGVNFIYYISNESDYMELCYSNFIEASRYSKLISRIF